MEFTSDVSVLASRVIAKKPRPSGVKLKLISFEEKGGSEGIVNAGKGASGPAHPLVREELCDNIYFTNCFKALEDKLSVALSQPPEVGGNGCMPSTVINCVAKGTSDYLFLNYLSGQKHVTAQVDVETWKSINDLKEHKVTDMKLFRGYLICACDDSEGQVTGHHVRVYRVLPKGLEEVYTSQRRYELKYYQIQVANGRILSVSSKGHVAFVSADPKRIAVILQDIRGTMYYSAKEIALEMPDVVHVCAIKELVIGLSATGMLQSYSVTSTVMPQRQANLLESKQASMETFTTIASAMEYTVATSIQKQPTPCGRVYLVATRTLRLLDSVQLEPDTAGKAIYPLSGIQLVQAKQAKYIVITEYFERFTLIMIKDNKLNVQIKRRLLFMEKILGTVFVVKKQKTISIVYGPSKFNALVL